MAEFSPILQTVRSKAGAQELAGAIDMLMPLLFAAKKGAFEKKLEKSVSGQVAQAIRNLLARHHCEPSDYPRVRELLLALKEKLRQTPVVKITCATSPSEHMQDVIADWFVRNVDKPHILDVGYDPALIAGVTIEYAGVYRDFSLRARLDKVFEGEREEILSTIANSK